MIEQKVMEAMQKRKAVMIDRKAFNEMLSHIRLNADDSKKILKSMQAKGLLSIRERQYVIVKKPKWIL